MNWEAFFRWSLTLAVLILVGVIHLGESEVPTELWAGFSFLIGNSMRLQFTAKK